MNLSKRLAKLVDDLFDIAILAEDQRLVAAEIFDGIHWVELRNQIKVLNKLIEDKEHFDNKAELIGLKNLCESLQTVAVEYKFQKKKKVFG